MFESALGASHLLLTSLRVGFKSRDTGKAIKEKLGIKVVSPKMTELFHGIRSQLTSLLDGLDPKDLATMSLGLSHSLSRCVCS